jgi:hypothetical protein
MDLYLLFGDFWFGFLGPQFWKFGGVMGTREAMSSRGGSRPSGPPGGKPGPSFK